MVTIVLLEMQAGKLPGIVSESEARGLETRRTGDLLCEGGIRVGVRKGDGEEKAALRVVVSLSPCLHGVRAWGCVLTIDTWTVCVCYWTLRSVGHLTACQSFPSPCHHPTRDSLFFPPHIIG